MIVETEREVARRQVAERMFPGQLVTVVLRELTYDDGRTHMITRVSTWKEVTEEICQLTKVWRPKLREIQRLERLRGPRLVVGDEAMVIAVLLKVEREPKKFRPWALLLTATGELGWCYTLDGFQLGG